MPMLARCATMASFVSRVRPCSGMRTIAMGPSSSLKLRFHHLPAANRFHQKFEDFDVTRGRVQILSPCVQAVPPDQKAVYLRILANQSRHLTRERAHVLAVLDDRHPLPMLVCLDAFETFEHFIAFDEESLRSG